MRGAAARSIIGFDDVNAAGGRQLPLYTSYTHRWLYFLHSPLAILSTFTVGYTFYTHRWLYFLHSPLALLSALTVGYTFYRPLRNLLSTLARLREALIRPVRGRSRLGMCMGMCMSHAHGHGHGHGHGAAVYW